ncbi:TOMM precursor leader peptide-binding protein [Cryobacterium sp. 1639]|uniref:TOMM precursor leader peptide-binding protein n=1 Tax=Cryobacterium inferilacus TaxID=2866629 RepID=UPI001C733699|nr:TOMM precursor leader peptide-binding protein [Cryobacterium sp. 1639]MBX0300040.1 TOMM precursor leader peptide-binding protein [Cryobacterium sp. 1639]
MVLRLDPRYPLVWRTPDTIQLGIDRPLAIVPGVTGPLETVIAALRVGVPESGALMLGRQAGATDAATSALLRALAPVLLADDPRPEPPDGAAAWFDRAAPEPGSPRRRVVCVDGDGVTADRIRGLVTDLGITVVPTAEIVPAAPAHDQASPAPDLTVIVDHFVLSPARHGRWLRRDVPHLPVLFSDAEVRIGPLVEPGAGPCLTCLELERVDEDPAWPAIACQLLHRTAPTESTRLGIQVAATVAGMVHDRVFAGSNQFAAVSLAIDAESLTVRRRAHRPHERCGCRFLPENVIVLAGNVVGFRRRTS